MNQDPSAHPPGTSALAAGANVTLASRLGTTAATMRAAFRLGSDRDVGSVAWLPASVYTPAMGIAAQTLSLTPVARRLLRFLLFVCGVAGALGARAEAPTKPLTFGVVPQQSASRLAEEWGPLLAEIGRRAGVPLIFRTTPSIPVFEQRLAQGDFDLAYMNPYHYVVFHKASGYRAFAKEQDRKIKGILVVRKDSHYRDLADLAGKTVVFPAPAAFAASILPQAEFGRLKIPVEARFVASHDSVYRAVSSGMQEAGGGIQRTLEASPANIRNTLRVLAETPAYTPHAFAAHPRVSPEVLARVLAAMRSLGDDATGQSLLAPLAFKGVVAAQNAEWNDVRALDIDLLERYGRQ